MEPEQAIAEIRAGDKPEPQQAPGLPVKQEAAGELAVVISALKDKLTDVSKKNRSLRLTTLNMRSHFDLGTLAEGKPADALLEKITSGKKARLVSLFAHDEEKMNAAYRLSQLQLEADFFEKETGNYDLYVGYPFAEGAFADGTYFKCPLVLFPVVLRKDYRRLELALEPDPDRAPVLNRAFLIGFQKFNSIAFDNEVPEEIDENGDPLEKAFAKYAELGMKFENRRTLENNLQTYVQNRGKTTSSRLRGKIKVLKNAVLGLFPQTASTLLSDYEALKRDPPTAGLLHDFFQEPDDGNPALRLKQTRIDVPVVTEVDDSQEEALAAARVFDGVVVHGPPGTGKSQVIVNLITGAVSQGKRVLVVCEKRAALDVVHNRLLGIGLGDLAVLVHDHGKDRNAVFEKAARILADYADRRLPGAEFDGARMEAVLDRLYANNRAMHEKLACGASLHELYSGDPMPKGPALPTLTLEDRVTFAGLKDIRARLEDTIPLAVRHDALQEKTPARRNLSEVSSAEWRTLEESLETAERMEPLLHGLCSSSAWKLLELARLGIHYPVTLRLEEDLVRLTRSGIGKFTDAAYWKAARYLDGLVKRCGEGRKEKDAALKAIAGASTAHRPKTLESIEALRTYNSWMRNVAGALEALEGTFGQDATGRAIQKAAAGGDYSAELSEIRQALKDKDGALTLDRQIKALSPEERIAFEIVYPLVKSGYGVSKSLDSLEHAVYSKWIQLAEQSRQDSFLERGQHEKLQREARSSAKKRKHFARRQAAAAWLAGIIQLPYGKRKDLQFQVEKPRHKWPLRRLMNEHAPALLKIFPCWLASPATVSSIFPLKEGMFDYVVFDEASQCPIEHAVPAMHRGRQLVVAGDEKQLPPFDLFEAYLEEGERGDDEDPRPKPLQDVSETKSLLQLARKRYHEVLLKWHYRSRHEELIGFSNHAFYRGRIAHTPNASASDEPPIEWVRVNGTWDHRKNRAEAEKVVRLVDQLISGRNPPSVGIITFNANQKELIQNLLERKARDDPDFYRKYKRERERMQNEEVQGLFVKNIENVQGDERDVIIFSIGYAPSPAGNVVAQYGSLAAEGGENRLNVAISRAREMIYVVASIAPEDLPVNEDSPTGPRLLKEYLRYAKFVSDGKTRDADTLLHSLSRMSGGTTMHATEANPLAVRLAETLQDRGLEIDSKIGASAHGLELAVVKTKKPLSYSLGIEFDGKEYDGMRELKEWELHRPEFLETRGWKLLRLSSREYWQDPDSIPQLVKQEARR
ncbi:MAG: AAA domain-containing protein [Candidatus Micrarchaeota archaeon]